MKKELGELIVWVCSQNSDQAWGLNFLNNLGSIDNSPSHRHQRERQNLKVVLNIIKFLGMFSFKTDWFRQMIIVVFVCSVFCSQSIAAFIHCQRAFLLLNIHYHIFLRISHQSYISHISVIYKSYISHISVIYQSYTSPISAPNQSYISHISVLYQSYISHITVIYQS